MKLSQAFRSLVPAAVVAGAFVAAPGVAHATTYQITRVASLSTTSPNTTAYGINAAGHVAGYSATSAGPFQGLLFRNGASTSVGGLASGSNAYSVAHAVNNTDQVVGYAYIVNPVTTFLNQRPFLWASGTITDLGIFTNYADVEATGINNFGQIVGFADSPVGGGPTKSWIWSNSTTTVLATLGGPSSKAFGINDSGQVVGSSDTTTGAQHAFIWQSGAIVDLGALPGGTFSEGVSINTSGRVVGVSTFNGSASNGDRHAVLWQNGSVIDLGIPPAAAAIGAVESFADGINATGTIVGGSGGLAFVYQNGTWTDLNTLIPAGSGVTLTGAIAINDNGQIAALGKTATRHSAYSYLLTPVP